MRSHFRQKARSERYHGGVDRRRVRALYNRRWAEYSVRYRSENPLCRRCLEKGLTVLAQVVDHIQPHRGNMDLFWDAENHQPLCKPCHDLKTATEDFGGARNLPRPGE